jgi:hypothetical protein
MWLYITYSTLWFALNDITAHSNFSRSSRTSLCAKRSSATGHSNRAQPLAAYACRSAPPPYGGRRPATLHVAETPHRSAASMPERLARDVYNICGYYYQALLQGCEYYYQYQALLPSNRWSQTCDIACRRKATPLNGKHAGAARERCVQYMWLLLPSTLARL